MVHVCADDKDGYSYACIPLLYDIPAEFGTEFEAAAWNLKNVAMRH